MQKNRTPEEQAAWEAEIADVIERDRRERERQAAEFIQPRHTRKEVARVLGARETMFQNWQNRNQIELDADSSREGLGWRLYSTRDLLKLGLAIKMSESGVQASQFKEIFKRLKHVFYPFSVCLAANWPVCIILLPDAKIIGPTPVATLDLAKIPASNFTVIRLDAVVRDVLEPLGYTITMGTAADHAEAAKRLENREDVE